VQSNVPAAPILRRNNTGLQGVRPATSTTGTSAVQTITAPQPILSPDGRPSPSTSPVAIQPRGSLGSAPVQTTGAVPHDTTSVIPANPVTATVPVIEASPKKPMNKTTLMVIGSMLSIALIIMCFVLFGAKEKQDLYDTYSTLIKDIESKKTLTVTKDDLDALLTGMVKTEIKDKIGGYTAMSKAQAKDGEFSPTLEIAKFVNVPGQDIKDESMKNIFLAIAINPNHDPEAHKLLLEYALENPNKPQSAEAINRMKKFADDSYIENILKVYDKTTQLATRTSAANTLTEIIKRSKTKSTIANTLIAKYNEAWDEKNKLAYLRLLGTTGSKSALKILYEALKKDEITFRLSAFKALATSPTIEPLESMLEVYTREVKEPYLSQYRDSIFGILETNKDLSDAQNTEHWKEVFALSPTERSQKHVVSELSGKEEAWAGKLLGEIAKSPDTNKAVKDFATEKLNRKKK
jgi:hypothetical protein